MLNFVYPNSSQQINLHTLHVYVQVQVQVHGNECKYVLTASGDSWRLSVFLKCHSMSVCLNLLF